MFKIMQIDSHSGEFIETMTSNSLNECIENKASMNEANLKHIIIYERSDNISEDEEDEILLKISELNGENLLRITKNARITIEKTQSASSCCGGSTTKCFCVVAHGSKRCETTWCNASGQCYTVPCSMPCGCYILRCFSYFLYF